MPADITGYELLQTDASGAMTGQEMVFRPGPVFGNLILADEINRAAPKTQSALLEAMAELHVTVGGTTYPLEEPFVVVATQNPIEQEGTYPLPEAQLDRFMMEIHVGYPSADEEESIVTMTASGPLKLPAARMEASDFLRLRQLVYATPAPAPVVKYAVHLVGASRPDDPRAVPAVKKYVRWGAGPRASQYLVLAAKARALLDGRAAPTPGDVRQLALPILRHRIIPNYNAIGDGVDSGRIIAHLVKNLGE
jgi:MoxR-like ATPase